MTVRDREATLIKYNEMFAAAQSEEDLLSKLGSPTRAAICELRGYVPSGEPEAAAEVPDAETPDMPSTVPDAQAAPEGLIPPEPMPEAIGETPEPAPGATAAEVPDAEIPDMPSTVPDAQAAPEGLIPPEPVPEDIEAAGEPSVLFDFSVPEETPEPVKAQKPRVLGGRLVLYILFGVVVCVPVTAVLIALSLCVLALGALLIASGAFVISLGFVGITVFADIMLLFGAGLIIAAIGVPIAFFAFWLFLRVVVGFVNLVLRTGGSWCYEHTKEARK